MAAVFLHRRGFVPGRDREASQRWMAGALLGICNSILTAWTSTFNKDLLEFFYNFIFDSFIKCIKFDWQCISKNFAVCIIIIKLTLFLQICGRGHIDKFCSLIKTFILRRYIGIRIKYHK